MPRFFNRIRRQLAKDNKFFQYSRYAIGEIVLVVIGILVALQINNWNEHRKETELYHSYLLRLKEDFKEILSATERAKLAEERLMELGKILLYSFKSETDSISPLQFAIAIDYSAGNYFYKKSSQTWEDLIATGNLKLLKNNTLRNEIGAYNTLIDQRNFQIQEWSTFTLKYRELTRSILEPEERIIIIGAWPFGYSDDPNLQELQLHTTKDEMKLKLRAIPELKGIVGDVVRARKNTVYFIENELELLHNILDTIDDEEVKLGQKKVANDPLLP